MAAPALPSDRDLRRVVAVVVLASLLPILDTTVVNVALGTLATELDAPLTTIAWTTTGYLLALAAVIPLSGWASERLGGRRLLAGSTALFLAGSALAAAAPSAEALVACRVAQGLGGGLILPAGMALVARAAGPQRMGRAMGAVGVPVVLGPALGPIAGGVLLDALSWRWIFLANLPLGAVALAAVLRALPPDAPTARAPLDRRGLVLLSPGLALLTFGLARIAADGGLSRPLASAGPLLAGAALLAAFAAHALRRPAPPHLDGSSGRAWAAPPPPLVDLRLLREPAVAASAAALLLLGGAFLGALLLLPLQLQLVRGADPLQAGLWLAPQGLGAAAAMRLAGRASDRVGAGRVVLAGLVPFAGSLAALALLGGDPPAAALVAALAAFGVGMGATMMPATSAALAALDRAQVAGATALLNVVQRLGSSLGTALAAVALSRALAARVPGAGGEADALAAARRAAGTADPAATARVAEAFGAAFAWPCALALLALVPAALLARRGR